MAPPKPASKKKVRATLAAPRGRDRPSPPRKPRRVLGRSAGRLSRRSRRRHCDHDRACPRAGPGRWACARGGRACRVRTPREREQRAAGAHRRAPAPAPPAVLQATPAADKAKKAALAVTKGVNGKKKIAIRTSVHFFRPKTRTYQRKPKYPRRSAPRLNKLDHFAVIK